jgi:hypothetical protein
MEDDEHQEDGGKEKDRFLDAPEVQDDQEDDEEDADQHLEDMQLQGEEAERASTQAAIDTVMVRI